MNRTIKSFFAIAIISAVTSAAFAAPKVNSKTLKQLDTTLEESSKSSKKEMVKLNEKEDKDSKQKERKDFPKKNIITLTGKVDVTKNGYVTFKTKDGVYILTTEDGPEGKNQITMKDIKKRNGSKLVLSGVLNKSSNVFTVIKNGYMKEGAPDAK